MVRHRPSYKLIANDGFILRMKLEGRKLMKRGIAALLTAGCFTVGSLSVAPAAKAADVLTLTSPAVQDNGMLAVKNAGSDKQRSPNCVGENVSPPLTWSNPPEGTKSFALLLVDPEGRAPTGVSHMVVCGISADV